MNLKFGCSFTISKTWGKQNHKVKEIKLSDRIKTREVIFAFYSWCYEKKYISQKHGLIPFWPPNELKSQSLYQVAKIAHDQVLACGIEE